MSVIHKFILAPADDQVVPMPCGPAGVTLLHVAFQHDKLCLWARVDPDYPAFGVRVHIRGTGHPMGEAELAGGYIGTVHTPDGLVFHVWAQLNGAVKKP